MLLISIWHGAWEQRKGCLSSVSKKEKLEPFLSSDSVTWTMSSSVFSLPASSWCLGHEQSFATQISEEPLFWCALVVPGGVKTWLSCLPKPVGFLFCRSEILAYAKFPWESSLWLQQDLAPGRKTCWKASSCLAAHLVLTGEVVRTKCLGLRQLKARILQNEVPPLLALTTHFLPARRDEWE